MQRAARRCPHHGQLGIGQGRGRARSLDVRVRSGSVDVGEVVGECKVVTSAAASSRDRGKRRSQRGVGDDRAARVGRRSRANEVGPGHGRLEPRGDIDIRGVSSTIRVSVPEGVAPELRLRTISGSVKKDVEQGARLRHLRAHRERLDQVCCP